jgi:hypothetical protein
MRKPIRRARGLTRIDTGLPRSSATTRWRMSATCDPLRELGRSKSLPRKCVFPQTWPLRAKFYPGGVIP